MTSLILHCREFQALIQFYIGTSLVVESEVKDSKKFQSLVHNIENQFQKLS